MTFYLISGKMQSRQHRFEYIHIGSDETYELAACEECKAKAKEIGRSGLFQLFINRSAETLKKSGRKVMAWETPMGWKMGKSPAIGLNL